jgi:phosphatidylglycerol:prolipoprotein diacylglycerol transferase
MHIDTYPPLHLVFDVLAWIAGGALALLLYRWRLGEIAPAVAARTGPGYALALAFGVVAGAWLFGSINTGLSAIPHPSHSIAGGLAGGIVAVEIWKWHRGINGSTGLLWVGPIAFGIAIGRIGCLLAGLGDETYGTPADLPWAVELGDGVPRHPVQLYESGSMVTFLIVYLVALGRRAAWTRSRAFYLFILFYGLQRFAWEFLKPYPRLVGPLDIFQLLAVAMIAYALVFDARTRRHR